MIYIYIYIHIGKSESTKTNVDSLHVQHSLRATVSQEDRDRQHFKTPTVRRAKSNDNTSTARPPQSPNRSPRTPREQTKKPRKGQCDRPESSATQQRIRRTADFPKPCLPSSSPYHGLHDTGCDPEANGRELTTNVLQQTSGLPRKSLRMPVNARQIAQDSPDRDLRRRMALESQFVSIA